MDSPFPASKLPNVGTTIFTVMSQLAAEYQSINLGQGFPGFPIDDDLIDKVHQAMKAGFNQYAPMTGLPALREQIGLKMQRLWGRNFNIQTQINITAGASQAIFTAIGALIHPGDEVILFAPAYDCYAPAIELNGGIVKWVNLEYPSFDIPWDDLESLLSEKTKLVMINTPHNPTGKVWSGDEISRMADWVKKNNLYLISDEVYEHITFDGRPHVSMAQFPEISEQTMLIYSFGKTFHATGWKLGYAIGPESWMAEFRKQHQFNVFTCNTPFQWAISEYMKDHSHYQKISPMYQAKRDLVVKTLEQSNFETLPAAGTYFQLIYWKGTSSLSDTDLAKKWTIENGITLIPTSVFYPDQTDNRVFRLCFAKEDVELLKGMEKIAAIGLSAD
jgi:methionine aminotransferase